MKECICCNRKLQNNYFVEWYHISYNPEIKIGTYVICKTCNHVEFLIRYNKPIPFNYPDSCYYGVRKIKRLIINK